MSARETTTKYAIRRDDGTYMKNRGGACGPTWGALATAQLYIRGVEALDVASWAGREETLSTSAVPVTLEVR